MSQQPGQDGGHDQYGPYGHQPPPPGTGVPGAGAPVPPPAPGDYGQYGGPPQGDYGQQPPGSYGQYGQQPPSAYGQYGSPGPGGYYGGGFVPVPTAVQPGIIPLRPLTLGEIYDGAFRAIRSNPLVMFGLAIIVIAAASLLQLGFTIATFSQIERALQSGATDLAAFFGIGSVLGLVLSVIVSSLATLVLEGLAIISVSESVIGRKISLAEVWRRARGKIWRLIGLSLVLGIGGMIVVGLGIVALVAVVAGLVQLAPDAWVVLLVLVPLVFLAVAALVAFIGVRLMLATCVIMLEGTGIFASLGRSWRLTRGHFWRLLGIMLLTVILVGILVSILSVPFTMFGGFFAGPEDIVMPLVLSSIGQLVGSALSIPVMAAVLALLYIDVRMRKEGLDVELARAAQAP